MSHSISFGVFMLIAKCVSLRFVSFLVATYINFIAKFSFSDVSSPLLFANHALHYFFGGDVEGNRQPHSDTGERKKISSSTVATPPHTAHPQAQSVGT